MSSRAECTIDAQRLLAHLLDELPTPTHYWVGFSGGVDSTVLLHLIAQIRASLPAPVSAIHIDHGLQAESANWSQHCARTAERCGIPYHSLRVDARPSAGESPEAAARVARYAAIADAIEDDAMLLTAHHLDDQAETLLLQLLRGAGVEGLAAMPACRRWQNRWHARPLLALRRRTLHAWAVEKRLHWIEDPSNAIDVADRNYLRNRVMPMLGARWPAAADNIARSAELCADAAETILGVAEADLAAAQSDDGALRLSMLRELPKARARKLLRVWLRGHALPSLSLTRLDEALSQLCDARSDADVTIECGDRAIRRFRDKAHVVAQHRLDLPGEPFDWQGDEVVLPAGLGFLRRVAAPGGISRQMWDSGRVQVGFRHADVRCRPAGREGTRSFKKLAQSFDIPPWERERIPILLIGGEVAALAGYCVCEPFAAAEGEQGWQLEWIAERNKE